MKNAKINKKYTFLCKSIKTNDKSEKIKEQKNVTQNV